MVASAGYMARSATVGEPVLAGILRNLAGDEARHAASFYAFAKRHLERSEDREADVRDALKVLYLWFEDNSTIRHPVNEFYARADAAIDRIAPRERIIALVGTLVGLPLEHIADVLGAMKGAR
jgi:DNA-directed RNA polymerase specialized sigma24 family protein